MTKTRGQLAYEADVASKPLYDDGQPRPPWHRLRDIARQAWERQPTSETR